MEPKAYDLSKQEEITRLCKEASGYIRVGGTDTEGRGYARAALTELPQVVAKYRKFVEALCEDDPDLDLWAEEYKHAFEQLSHVGEVYERALEFERWQTRVVKVLQHLSGEQQKHLHDWGGAAIKREIAELLSMSKDYAAVKRQEE